MVPDFTMLELGIVHIKGRLSVSFSVAHCKRWQKKNYDNLSLLKHEKHFVRIE